MSPATRQQQAFGFGQSRGWREGVQSKNAGHNPMYVIIGRDQPLGVQLAERDASEDAQGLRITSRNLAVAINHLFSV